MQRNFWRAADVPRPDRDPEQPEFQNRHQEKQSRAVPGRVGDDAVDLGLAGEEEVGEDEADGRDEGARGQNAQHPSFAEDAVHDRADRLKPDPGPDGDQGCDRAAEDGDEDEDGGEAGRRERDGLRERGSPARRKMVNPTAPASRFQTRYWRALLGRPA